MNRHGDDGGSNGEQWGERGREMVRQKRKTPNNITHPFLDGTIPSRNYFSGGWTWGTTGLLPFYRPGKAFPTCRAAAGERDCLISACMPALAFARFLYRIVQEDFQRISLFSLSFLQIQLLPFQTK